MTGGTNQGNLDLNVLARLNKDIQKQILTIYFYLLKSEDNHNSNHLLLPVFEGIPKFAKLVNIELAENIIDVIRDYLSSKCFEQQSDSQSKQQFQSQLMTNNFQNILSALHCAVRIEEQIGDAVGIQQNKSLIKVLYKIMSAFIQKPGLINSKTTITILIKCLQSIFLKKRAYSYKTICAIVKKLAIVSAIVVEQNNAVVASFLFMIRLLFNKYPQISMNMLMDLKQFYAMEEFGQDPFNLQVQDPDLSNADKSVIAYELLIIKQKLLRQNEILKQKKQSDEIKKSLSSSCSIAFKILQSIIDLSQLPKETLGLVPDRLYMKLSRSSFADVDNLILSLQQTK